MNECILLAQRQRGFLAGTLGFPLIPIKDSLAREQLRIALEQLSDVASVSLSEMNVRHTITRHKLEVGQLRIDIQPQQGAAEAVVKNIFKALGLQLDRDTWVSKNLVSEKVSSGLDLKVWEKIS